MGSREDDECIEWSGALRNGYGCRRVDGKTQYVHRLAFEQHNGRKPSGVVRHKCDNRLCYNPLHLEEGSRADNSRDMVTRGRSRKGELHPTALLTDQEVLEVRDLYRTGSMRTIDIAKAYGISRQNVYSIGTLRSWKHV
jgi:hypothetical protein